MQKLILVAAASLPALLAIAAPAQAETWSGTRTGPYGVTRSGTAHCGPYGCGWNMHATGPNGATWSRRGGYVQGPYGGASYRAFTGPNGNTYARGGWWRRY